MRPSRILSKLTEELFVAIAEEIAGGLQLPYNGATIDLTRPWQRLTIREAMLAHGGAEREETSASWRACKRFARAARFEASISMCPTAICWWRYLKKSPKRNSFSRRF